MLFNMINANNGETERQTDDDDTALSSSAY